MGEGGCRHRDDSQLTTARAGKVQSREVNERKSYHNDRMLMNCSSLVQVEICSQQKLKYGNHHYGGRHMVTLEFHDPSGALDVTQQHAPRLASLAGKRIGFVSNEQWQAYRMLPLLKGILEADFPGIEVLSANAFPQGNALIGNEETAALVKKSGVDAVIVANAA